jgi:hypothetical protein
MGTNRWKKYKIELLPIKIPKNKIESDIEDLVNRIIFIKKESNESYFNLLTSQLDLLVYQLYGLTEEEIALVESLLG